MRKLPVLFVASITVVFGLMAASSLTASTKIDGEWQLTKVDCANPAQGVQLNKQIGQGDYEFVLRFESQGFRETIEEKNQRRHILAISVGTYTFDAAKKEIVLTKSSTSLTEGGRTMLNQWSAQDLSAQKRLGWDLRGKTLLLSSATICDDGPGSLQFEKN